MTQTDDSHPTHDDDTIETVRETLIMAALPDVAFDGWSRQTMRAAARASDTDLSAADAAFPRGGIDMALAFHRLMDGKMAEALPAKDLAEMRIRDRITQLVRTRLEVVGPHKEAVRRGAVLLAMPIYAAEGARAIWGTADLMWRLAGDTDEDFNWYSKRAILSSVYSATVLYWLGDQDPRSEATWAFLNRRIEEVMQFEKTKASLAKNPFAQLAFAVPNRVLSMIRAPRSRSL